MADAKKFDPKKAYRVKLDTWLMGHPVRAGETGLTEAQIEHGLAAGSVEEYEPAEGDAVAARPNGITEPIANQAHTAITQDSVRKIQGEITGDANKTVAEAAEVDSKKK